MATGFLLTVGASLGATVAVFQWGWLGAAVNLDVTGPLISLTPILVSLLLKWSPLGPAYYVGALCLLLGGAWLAAMVGVQKAIAAGVAPFVLGGVLKSVLGAALLKAIDSGTRKAAHR